MIRATLTAFSLCLLIGCAGGASIQVQVPSGNPGASAPLLVQTADGHYLSVSCLKQHGLTTSAKKSCAVTPAAKTAQGTRGFSSTGGGYILYPPNYTQTRLCSYLGVYYPCYPYLGYPQTSDYYELSLNFNYTWPSTYGTSNGSTSWNNCDSCLTNPYQYACLYGSVWSCVPSYNGYYGGLDSRPRVACAGGPYAPAYAFWDFSSAQLCAQRIAASGGACATDARVGYCSADSWTVGAVAPIACICDPANPAIGNW